MHLVRRKMLQYLLTGMFYSAPISQLFYVETDWHLWSTYCITCVGVAFTLFATLCHTTIDPSQEMMSQVSDPRLLNPRFTKKMTKLLNAKFINY